MVQNHMSDMTFSNHYVVFLCLCFHNPPTANIPASRGLKTHLVKFLHFIDKESGTQKC